MGQWIKEHKLLIAGIAAVAGGAAAIITSVCKAANKEETVEELPTVEEIDEVEVTDAE